jgi:hypothetical protein
MADNENLPPEPQAIEQVPKKTSLTTLLPGTSIELNEEEIAEVYAHQLATRVLGPAAGAVLVCPGNQCGLPDEQKCPYFAKCPLLRMQKAPEGRLCPFEKDIVEQRFGDWCRELGAEPDQLSESQRAVVADLVWLDVQEQRCVNIMSSGKAARMTQINVKESHPETGEHLAWERVIHSNMELLDRVHTQRRLIMKDWELTPEMKTKKAKLEGKGKGNDLSSQLSAKADRLRRITRPIEIEVPNDDK